MKTAGNEQSERQFFFGGVFGWGGEEGLEGKGGREEEEVVGWEEWREVGEVRRDARRRAELGYIHLRRQKGNASDGQDGPL